MVLKGKTDRGPLSYLFGICIIASSIYAYYIGTAMRNSPELFLVPKTVEIKDYPCTSIASEKISACIPASIDSTAEGGTIEFYSIRNRIRGTIEIMDGLPQEGAWRASFKSPFMKFFLGDVDRMGTYELMNTVLQHRYNPTLMGAKAALIPPWMGKTSGAAIVTPKGGKGFVFYTPYQCLGIMFEEAAIVVMSIKGRIAPDTAAGIMSSVRPVTQARPKTGSRGSS